MVLIGWTQASLAAQKNEKANNGASTSNASLEETEDDDELQILPAQTGKKRKLPDTSNDVKMKRNPEEDGSCVDFVMLQDGISGNSKKKRDGQVVIFIQLCAYLA